MSPARDDGLSNVPLGVNERRKEVEAHLEGLEEKLEEEDTKKELLEVIDSAVKDGTSQSLERDLVESFNRYFQDDNTGQLLVNVLANNDPYVFRSMGIELEASTLNFFETISRRYGTKVKNSIKTYYTPDDWRYVSSEARQGGKYQGKRLESKILKWDGSTCKLTSSLPDMVKLVTHFIINLANKFESLEGAESKKILQNLDNLEDSIERLKANIRSDARS